MLFFGRSAQLQCLFSSLGWEPRIGDPSFIAWFTVGCYFLAAFLCFVQSRRDRFDGGLWKFLAAMLMLLGINKQLDFQTLLTQFGRDLAREQGWYEQRRVFQQWFMAAVAAGGLFVTCLLAWFLRGRLWRNGLALVGTFFLVCFVLIRAASFHHVDQVLGLRAFTMPVHAIFELGGITCIMLAAFIRLTRSEPRRRAAAASTR